jgi:uncharacterized membrane protein
MEPIKPLQIDISGILSRSYAIFKKEPAMFILFTLLSFGLSGILSLIPVLGALINILISPLISAAFILAAFKVDQGGKLEWNDFFAVQKWFTPLFVSYLLSGVFILIGFLFLILPGIFLAVCFALIQPFVLFQQNDGMQSMKSSYRAVLTAWFPVFAFFLVMFIIIVLSIIPLGLGLLITIPLFYISVYVMFKDNFPLEGTGNADTDTSVLDSGI